MARRAVAGLLSLLSLACASYVAGGGLRHPRLRASPPPAVAAASLRIDLVDQCDERWRDATLDHFSWAKPEVKHASTFRQRYFVCDRHWRRPASGAADGADSARQEGLAARPRKPPGPIFFYLGNEADVTLYLNNTGLMWESAPDFQAMLVFAE